MNVLIKIFKGAKTPEKIEVPKSVQQSIPIKTIYKDGIMRVGDRFSKTLKFIDINYSVASYDNQMEMFLGYCGVLNSLATDAVTKITINNRKLNTKDFEAKGVILST